MDDFTRTENKFQDGHRRTSSSNSESYAAFKAQRGHRRTMSNTQVDLHRVLATSPSAETALQGVVAPKKQVEEPLSPDSLGGSEVEGGLKVGGRGKMEERLKDEPRGRSGLPDVSTKPSKPSKPLKDDHSPQDKEKDLKRKSGNGFLGMLEAAITYFAEDRPIKPISSQASQAEALGIRTAITGLKQRLTELEAENEAIKKTNAKLAVQHDHYERHIGALNAKVQDLQHQVDGQHTVSLVSDTFNPNESVDSLEDEASVRPIEGENNYPILSRRALDDSPDQRSRLAAAAVKPSRMSGQKGKVKVTSAIYFS